MSYQTTTTHVSATVSLRVPRGGSDTLESGVAGVLTAIPGVSEVTVERVRSVQPGYTDIRVDAAVSLTVDVSVGKETDAATRLAEGFGVTGVRALDVREP